MVCAWITMSRVKERQPETELQAVTD